MTNIFVPKDELYRARQEMLKREEQRRNAFGDTTERRTLEQYLSYINVNKQPARKK